MTGDVAALVLMPDGQFQVALMVLLAFEPYRITGEVAWGNNLLQDAFQCRALSGRFGPVKGNRMVSKPDYESALPLLGQAKIQGVQKFPIDAIPQIVQDFGNLCQGLTAVVR